MAYVETVIFAHELHLWRGEGVRLKNTLDFQLCQSFSLALAPLSPPQNFTVTVDGPNSLRFSWGPPTEDDRVGSITSYWLSCDPQPEGLPRTYQAQDFTRTGGVMAVVSGFTPSTTYNCSVMASNMAGSGPTASATATTPEDCESEYLYINLQRSYCSLLPPKRW